jgi:UDP-2,4-diacetamido-2,4,6-trideoxy-beta-L-altropyranose hydrolase
MIPVTATPRKPAGAPRILFFADAGSTVGGGHVMRCLTLAQALRQRGAVCGFVANPAAAAILDAFGAEGIERVSAAGEGTAMVLAAARDWSADVVVVDHYGFGRVDETALRAPGRVLMAMDDLRRAHDCDLVLDSNLGRTEADYPGIQALAGPVFALVRPEFVALREAALARRALGETPRRLLVSLGLTDVGGVTARVVQALMPELGELTLDVVLGEGAASLKRLRSLAARDDRVRLHINTRHMPALTAQADLAIGAGGSSTWERCCLGLPTVTVVLADNQRPNALALEAAGAALTLEADAGDFDDRLRAMFRELIGDSSRRQKIGQVAATLCDGQGAERIADRLLTLTNRENPSPLAGEGRPR